MYRVNLFSTLQDPFVGVAVRSTDSQRTSLENKPISERASLLKSVLCDGSLLLWEAEVGRDKGPSLEFRQ